MSKHDAQQKPGTMIRKRDRDKDDTAMDTAMTDTTTFSGLPGSAAKMMAVEVLLAEPESLGMTCLKRVCIPSAKSYARHQPGKERVITLYYANPTGPAS